MKDSNSADLPNHEETYPLMFPCLLWEPTYDIVVLATATGTGTVLQVGESQVLQLGWVIPFMASRWQYGNEAWDFIVPPPDTKITLRNKFGPERRPVGLEAQMALSESWQN